MNAWLLTWEGTEGFAMVPDRKVVAILSARKSERAVIELVRLLYCRTVESAGDMAKMANRQQLHDKRYRHIYSTGSRISYGGNPYIFARRVENLAIQRDESRGVEIVHWHQPATYRNAVSDSGIEEDIPARDCELIRSLVPLAPQVDARRPA